MRYLSTLIAFMGAFLTISPVAATAAETMNKEQVQAIIKEYLLANPEVVVDSLNAYQEKKASEETNKTKSAIKDNEAALFKNRNVPNVGAKDADVVMVEFFDYHCGYCKHMLPTITKLLEEDKKLRVVFHEFPILSDESKKASIAALAVYRLKPEAYFQYHTTLLSTSGKFSDEFLQKEAEKLGIKAKDFNKAIADPAIEAELEKTRELAKKLGLSGTPAFIIGEEFVPGAGSYETLKALIDNERASGGKK